MHDNKKVKSANSLITGLALFLRTNTLSSPCVTLCGFAPRLLPTLGRDDRSHRVPRGTRGGLRADGHAGHQKSTQVSKQSPTGESSPDITRRFAISFASNWSLFFSPYSFPHPLSSNPLLIFILFPSSPFLSDSILLTLLSVVSLYYASVDT